MPYFRAKAGMPAFASYARTAARACGGRPAAGWSVASAEGTPTTLPIRSDHHATAIEGEPAAMEASLRVSNMDMLTPRCWSITPFYYCPMVGVAPCWLGAHELGRSY